MSEVPEETNRKIIDGCSLYNLPYTENSKLDPNNERYHKNFVFKIGDPIKEVLDYYKSDIDKSEILQKLGIMPWNWDGGSVNPFALLTFHRTENVDNKTKAKGVVDASKRDSQGNTRCVFLSSQN